MATADRLLEVMSGLLEQPRVNNRQLLALQLAATDLQCEQAKTSLVIGDLRLAMPDNRLRVVENIVLRQAS